MQSSRRWLNFTHELTKFYLNDLLGYIAARISERATRQALERASHWFMNCLRTSLFCSCVSRWSVLYSSETLRDYLSIRAALGGLMGWKTAYEVNLKHSGEPLKQAKRVLSFICCSVYLFSIHKLLNSSGFAAPICRMLS